MSGGISPNGMMRLPVKLKHQWSKTAINILPFELLYAQVSMNEKETHIIINAPKGTSVCGESGTKQSGICHALQIIPRMREDVNALKRVWSLGNANPRQPVSSPNGPTRKANNRVNKMKETVGFDAASGD